MAEGGRSVWRLLWHSIKNSIRYLPPKGELVGEDHLGNKYFQAAKGHVTNRKLPVRWFEPLKENDWQQALPAEWEAWLRNRRKHPPTVEEVMKNAAIAQMKKERGDEIKKKIDEERGYTVIETQPITRGFKPLEGLERDPGSSFDDEKK